MKKLPFIFLLPLLSTVSVAEQLNYKSFRPHIPTPYEVGYEMEQGRIQARIEYENRKKEEEEYLNVIIKKAFLKQDIEDALTYARKNLSQIGYEYVKILLKKKGVQENLVRRILLKESGFMLTLKRN